MTPFLLYFEGEIAPFLAEFLCYIYLLMAAWLKKTWKVGVVRGIDIRISWTAPILPLLFCYLFSKVFSDWRSVALATCGLLGSLFLHEFGHMAAALLCKKQVKHLALYGFGMAVQQEVPHSTLKALFVSVAGPLVNLVLAGLLWVVDFGPVGDALRVANLFLGFFNLLPVGPLDGGNIVQVLIARAVGYQVASHLWALLSVAATFLVGSGLLFFFSWNLFILGALTLTSAVSFSFSDLKSDWECLLDDAHWLPQLYVSRSWTPQRCLEALSWEKLPLWAEGGIRDLQDRHIHLSRQGALRLMRLAYQGTLWRNDEVYGNRQEDCKARRA